MTQRRQAFDPNQIHQSAGIQHLHYRNFRIGKNRSWKNSMFLGLMAPLMSGELLFRSILTVLFNPLRGARSICRWAIGLAILLTFAPFGMVYLGNNWPAKQS